MMVDLSGKLKMLKELKKIIQSSEMRNKIPGREDDGMMDEDDKSVSVVKVSSSSPGKDMSKYDEEMHDDEIIPEKIYNDNEKNKMKVFKDDTDEDIYLKKKIKELFNEGC